MGVGREMLRGFVRQMAKCHTNKKILKTILKKQMEGSKRSAGNKHKGERSTRGKHKGIMK